MTLEKEILKLRLQLERETNKDVRRILQEQKKELENMRDLVGGLYMKYANDEGIIEMDHIEEFNEMKKVEKEVIESSSKLAEIAIAITGASLVKSYVDSYYKTAGIVDKGVSIGINYKLLRKEFIDAVVNANFQGQTYSDRIWKNHSKLANKLYQVIGDGITEGTSIQKLSKEIKDTFGTSAFEAQRLVNDQMARVVSEAQDQIYQDSGVVNELMFVATLDDVTSDICQNLDSNVYKLTDNYPSIPGDTHIGCRSCYIPIVSGYSATTRRDNKSKQEIPFADYKSWKKGN